MKSRQPQIAASLGPERAQSFGGGSAGANVGLIQSLPEDQRLVARTAFADSLSTMWIMYVVFAGLGLIASLCIKRNVLNKQHEEAETGLEAEKKKRLEREAERAERRKKRASKGSLPLDPEANGSGVIAEDEKATSG